MAGLALLEKSARRSFEESGQGWPVLLSAKGTSRQSMYTNMNRPSQTTSTKCQYQATASKPKW